MSVTVRPPLGKCHVTTMPFMPYSLTVSIMLSAPSLQGVLEGEGKEWGMGLSLLASTSSFPTLGRAGLRVVVVVVGVVAFLKNT